MTTLDPYLSAPLTPEQAAQLAADTQAQAAAASAPITQVAQETQAQITQRGPLLPAETAIDEMMALIRAQSEQLARLTSQVGTMQAANEQALAAAGGPLTVRYAQAAADKLAAHAAQWPGHDLSAAAAAADDLLSAAKAVVGGDKSAAPVLQSAERAVARVARKLPHMDWSAILDDVALAAEEGIKLAAVA